MKKGRLVEYGPPHRLLERQGSWFKSLYEEVTMREDADDDIDIVC